MILEKVAVTVLLNIVLFSIGRTAFFESALSCLIHYTSRTFHRFKMVVIKECFPTQLDFINNYIDKKRQQMEILKQRNFKFSSVPRVDEVIIPFDEFTQKSTENIGDMKTPKIIPLADEPVYMKNFKMFIKHTQRHLDQVLANNRRIDDFHDIVTEIQKPSADEERLDAGANPAQDDMADKMKHVEAEFSNDDDSKSPENESLSEFSPNEETASQLKSRKILKNTNSKLNQNKSKRIRYEDDVKTNSFIKNNNNIVKKLTWSDQSRKLSSKTLSTVRKNMSTSSLEMIPPARTPGIASFVSSDEKIRKVGGASKNKSQFSERSTRSLSGRLTNSPLNCSRSTTRDKDIITPLSSYKILNREFGIPMVRRKCSNSPTPPTPKRDMVQIPVSIINL